MCQSYSRGSIPPVLSWVSSSFLHDPLLFRCLPWTCQQQQLRHIPLTSTASHRVLNGRVGERNVPSIKHVSYIKWNRNSMNVIVYLSVERGLTLVALFGHISLFQYVVFVVCGLWQTKLWGSNEVGYVCLLYLCGWGSLYLNSVIPGCRASALCTLMKYHLQPSRSPCTQSMLCLKSGYKLKEMWNRI